VSRAEKFRLHEVPAVEFILYILLRYIVGTLMIFPFEMGPSIARVLGTLIRWIDRKHVRIATKNLERSRGVCPPDRIPAFIAKVYEHVALGFVEMLMTPRLLRRRHIPRYVKLHGLQHFDRCLQEGKGCIVALGHLGNWEFGGIAVNLAGYTLHSLMRPLRNPWLNEYLLEYRKLTGQQMIPRDRALGEMIRVLQRNKILIVQVDQDARDAGVFVNFFGRPASTHRAPATLSLKYGAPIIMVNVYRQGLKTLVFLTEPIYPEAYREQPDPVKALTQVYTDRFEEFVRQHPEQWFWMHDRWKTAERAARAATGALV
jgi:KDO2-lipid IV(A) lauroyltransferase